MSEQSGKTIVDEVFEAPNWDRIDKDHWKHKVANAIDSALAQVRAEEREACAKIARSLDFEQAPEGFRPIFHTASEVEQHYHADRIADAIHARGDQS